MAFQAAWKRRDEEHSKTPARAPQIDAELYRTRTDSSGRKIPYAAKLNSLPNGCFVQVDNSAFLIWNDALFLWTPERYVRKYRRPNGLMVTVLTPQPIVQCYGRGYEPKIHISGYAL